MCPQSTCSAPTVHPQCKVCPLNPTLTLTHTPILSLVLTPHLTLPLPLTLIKTEYWDRAGGGGNISYDW